MALSPELTQMLNTAWTDGYPVLLATTGPNGPNVSPKGSLVVYDDDHFAFWERSKKQAYDNLQHDKRVCLIYANFPAQLAGKLKSGFLRFYGTAELHDSGPVKDRIFSMLSKREQEHVGADTGIGVLVRIERAIDTHGRPVM
jgi:hypothetical protein